MQLKFPKNEYGQVMTYEERRKAGLLTPTQKGKHKKEKNDQISFVIEPKAKKQKQKRSCYSRLDCSYCFSSFSN